MTKRENAGRWPCVRETHRTMRRNSEQISSPFASRRLIGGHRSCVERSSVARTDGQSENLLAVRISSHQSLWILRPGQAPATPEDHRFARLVFFFFSSLFFSLFLLASLLGDCRPGTEIEGEKGNGRLRVKKKSRVMELVAS